ncbi:MAG: ParB/RepB/Spo0J family partition protein [Gammaproteobacteria bacterium]|nr:ParB/RepB/Spo0J family partition protein [Gammaproteobacteria bacterium]
MTNFKVGGGLGNKPTRQSELDSELEKMLVEGEHSKISVEMINPDPQQPRKKMVNLEKLADSLTKNGQIQPIVLRKDAVNLGRFIIVAGERRWRAAQIAGFDAVEAIVRDFSSAELQKITRLQMAENRDRESLTPLEDATWHLNYVNNFFGGDQTKAAEDLGVSDSYVSNRLMILKADDEVLEFADEDVTRDINTIVYLKRLYEKNKKSARSWMKDARADKVPGSLRTSVQEVLKETKEKTKTKTKSKKMLTPKPGREAAVKLLGKKPILSISFNGKEEQRYTLDKADLARLTKELAAAKKSLK